MPEIRFRYASIALFGLITAGCDARSAGPAAPSAPASAVPACAVTGAKLVAPALNEAQVCERFMAALRTGLPAGTATTVRLSFKPPGLAEAAVTLTHPGAAPITTSHALGVSDRRFRAEDIDSLAREVLRALSAPPSQ